MPTASDEERARWGICEEKAERVLFDAGYTLTKGWQWYPPNGREPTEEEESAILFLIHEWDYGGTVDSPGEHPYQVGWEKPKRA